MVPSMGPGDGEGGCSHTQKPARSHPVHGFLRPWRQRGYTTSGPARVVPTGPLGPMRARRTTRGVRSLPDERDALDQLRRARLEAVDVYTAREVGRVEDDRLRAGGHRAVYERGDLAAEHVVDLEGDLLRD